VVKARRAHLCRVAGNIVWSHIRPSKWRPRHSEVGFREELYTLYSLLFWTVSRKTSDKTFSFFKFVQVKSEKRDTHMTKNPLTALSCYGYRVWICPEIDFTDNIRKFAKLKVRKVHLCIYCVVWLSLIVFSFCFNKTSLSFSIFKKTLYNQLKASSVDRPPALHSNIADSTESAIFQKFQLPVGALGGKTH